MPLPPEGFLLRDLNTVTTGALPVRLEASIMGCTILLRALINLRGDEVRAERGGGGGG